MALITTSSVEFKSLKLSRREQLVMLEIGKDKIDTASSFVDYMQENYGFSKSSIWYCLNRLKEFGLVEFANKVEQGKPLSLTKTGLSGLGKLEGNKNELVTQFSNTFLNSMGNENVAKYYGSSYIRSRYAL